MKRAIVTFLLLTGLIITSCNNSNHESDAYGNFESRETIVSSQTSGQLVFFDIEEGQSIEAGKLVAITDTSQALLNISQLKAKKESIAANLNNMDANIAVVQAQKNSLKIEINRGERLLKDQAITQKQMDELNGKMDVLDKQAQAYQVSKNSILAELNAMDTQIAIAEDQLKKCYIINPVNGTILDKYIEPFEMVAPGKALYKIADLATMELKAYISGSQLPHIKPGQTVKVRIDEDKSNNKELEGTITWISPKAEFTPKVIQTKEERVNLVYAIKVSVKNDGSIKIGMPGEVKF